MTQDKDQRFKSEVVNLVQYIRRFREEVAQMVAADGDQTRFETMSDQLDAIVAATEDATNTILEKMEKVDQHVALLRQADDADERAKLCDAIDSETVAAMEACTFQDITGQRVTKIVRSMKFVEERVNSMIDLWGQEEINRLATEFSEKRADEITDDEALLNGPALEKEASISQDEIDKLFD
ncbi:MAG: protein phosphatase CheZ [Alphaproteobacteria bacterium]